MDLHPDTLLKDRYRIERALGHGGMGAVFLAFDTSLDNQVAVKANRSPAPHSTSQFLREARLLASLRHPHLPRVTDYFILDDAQYLVMDYIPGKDLHTLLEEEGPQPFERIIPWAQQIGTALTFLHQLNPPIIHRDVKPANVRLTDEGEVILVDFGIAKLYDPNSAQTTSGIGYTPGYAPPEQYGGALRTGPYTDQYALAAMIYHLLTGQKPADSVRRAVGQATLAPISNINPDVPPQAQAAIERGLSLRAEERFNSVAAFLNALSSTSEEVTVMGLAADSEATVDFVPIEATVDLQAVQQPTGRSTAATVSSTQAKKSQAQTVLAGAGQASQPAEAPSRRGPGMAMIVLGALLGLLVLGLVVGGALLAPQFLRPTDVAPAAAQVASDTPQPLSSDTPAPVIAPAEPTSTATIQPTSTATDQPTATTEPSETPSPTRPPTMGGGGVIVFSSDRADGQTLQLWTMRVALNDMGGVDTHDLAQLTDSPGNKTQPAWSPDGKRLVYVAPGEAGKGLDLWIMNADGSGEPVNITGMKGDELEPSWSYDGEWIAFTSDARTDGVMQLYLVRLDGTTPYRLSFDQQEFGPAWAPDGRLAFVMKVAGNQILHLRGKEDPKTGATPTRAYYVTPSFFDWTTLKGNLGQVAEPVWSADGNFIAYTRQQFRDNRIYIARFPVRIPEVDIIALTTTRKDSGPSWSPDGQWLVFTSERDDNSEIYITRSTGLTQINLTNAPSKDQDPAWQPMP
jgi:eukaryotic-like serine/threonine-protein kinase